MTPPYRMASLRTIWEFGFECIEGVVDEEEGVIVVCMADVTHNGQDGDFERFY